MPTYTVAQIAAQLKVEPKLLRRLLRADKTLAAPGSGSSWSFTDAQIPYLQDLVTGHKSGNKSKTAKTTPISDDPGLPAAICRSSARTDRARVRAITAERTARLEAALRQAGLHISQLKPTAGRVWVTQDEAIEDEAVAV